VTDVAAERCLLALELCIYWPCEAVSDPSPRLYDVSLLTAITTTSWRAQRGFEVYTSQMRVLQRWRRSRGTQYGSSPIHIRQIARTIAASWPIVKCSYRRAVPDIAWQSHASPASERHPSVLGLKHHPISLTSSQLTPISTSSACDDRTFLGEPQSLGIIPPFTCMSWGRVRAVRRTA